jgi:RNA polymerase sigma-70 factor, ECF subfamily
MSSMADGLAAASQVLASAFDFNAWMLAEQRRVFLLCYRMLSDYEEADSATQDVFLKAYRALQKQQAELDEPAKWVTRIAINTCLDRLRSRKWQFWRRRPSAEDESTILLMEADREPDAEARAFARQIGERLAVAMQTLSARQRAVFGLRHYEEKSLEEIANILGLDTGTVKAHMARAVAKLRNELRDLYEMRKR